MIVVDTNVISESIRPAPAPQVRAWLNVQSPSDLWVSTVTISELLLGVELLDAGRRQMSLRAKVGAALAHMFADRVLPFDRDAAAAFARITAETRQQGRSLSIGDGQIAASAMVRGFAVATRDVAPFEAAGLAVIDPWA